MTPIVSPWVFYLMSLVEPVCAAVLVLSFAIMCMWIVKYILKDGDYKPGAASKILLTALVMICIFIPSESTITKMLVAKNITYERVGMVSDTVETVYNDIMDLFDKEEE